MSGPSQVGLRAWNLGVQLYALSLLFPSNVALLSVWAPICVQGKLGIVVPRKSCFTATAAYLLSSPIQHHVHMIIAPDLATLYVYLPGAVVLSG